MPSTINTGLVVKSARSVFLVLVVAIASRCAPSEPDRLFNGRDLTGWHISASSPHGRTQGWHVADGTIVGTQEPAGQGGVLLTDRRYGDVEVSLDVMLSEGCDSGLFLRSSERGEAYQVMLDNVENGVIGSIYGEQLDALNAPINDSWKQAWRPGDWNNIRVRIEGAAPHITVWINRTLMTDWTDTANHAADGAVDGAIGLQVHGGDRWTPGGTLRVRSITVKPLR